jgi:hypothetical protein
MGFDFQGFVLRAPRTSPSNATTTSEATNGVDRDFKPLDNQYAIASPPVVEVSADQYRASTLLRSEDGETQYLIWAATTGNLRDVIGLEVSNQAQTLSPSEGLTVENQQGEDGEGNPIFGPSYKDGSTRLIFIDQVNRTIASLTEIRVVRGDTGEVVDLTGRGTFNSTSGVFTITDDQALLDLGGGISAERRDQSREKYLVEGPTFWWTKNDKYENRFVWDGALQRWRPIRGSGPKSLGRLLADTSYKLSPVPPYLKVGAYLPGDSDKSDSYSMLRLGRRPDASSLAVAQPVDSSGFGGIKIVEDGDVQTFDFGTEPELAGVVGLTSGVLGWNPAFIEEYAGQEIWYSNDVFVDSTTVLPVGSLEGSDLSPLFIAPVPGPSEYPFIRIGSRSPLRATLVDTEAQLSALDIQTGQVGVALSTGRLKFSSFDLNRADPDSPDFDINYLGVEVFYDGISMTGRPVPLRRPVPLVDSSGEPTEVGNKNHRLFIPDASPTPFPGVSGVVHVPDGTGQIPTGSSAAGIRPGNGSGLLRSLEGPWDTLLFGEEGQFTRIRVFDDQDEQPKFRFRIPQGTAYVDLRKGPGGSEVILGRRDLQRFSGKTLYFLQSGITPSTFAFDARVASRIRREWTLKGDEVFVFAIQGAESIWDASLDPGGVETSKGGVFTAQEIAQSLNAVALNGSVEAINGRVVIKTGVVSNGRNLGTIEIGFGPDGTKDLSGPSALGFLPGWRVSINATEDPNNPDVNWLPDNGSTLGVFRSGDNLSGSNDAVVDINHVSRFNDIVLNASVSASPVVLLDRVPLQDIAGYDDGIFFRLQDGFSYRNLENYDEILHQFGEGKFSWANRHVQFSIVEQPTNNLFLGQGLVIPNSFRAPGRFFRFSEGGSPFEELELGENFLLPDEGDSGVAQLIDTVGALKLLGARGIFTEGGSLFIDKSPDVDFVALGVTKGWQLKVTSGDAQGTYIVAEDPTDSNELVVSPAFLASGSLVSWEIYEGVPQDQFDPGVVADVQFTQFNHLQDDPFKVRILSLLGPVPKSVEAQGSARLVAALGQALESNRDIQIRFGSGTGTPDGILRPLSQTVVGTLSNFGLKVPTSGSERFSQGAFSIRIGTQTYSFSNGDLVKVSDFTASLTGDVVEVNTQTGSLRFGNAVFSKYQSQEVVYVEEFLTPTLSSIELPGRTVEYRPLDGALNFSFDDITLFGGRDAYLQEQLVADGQIDVTLNPIQGSLFLTNPLRDRQIVEVDYFVAERGTGDRATQQVDPEDPAAGEEFIHVVEQLPLFVRLEQATPKEEGDSVKEWSFNPMVRALRSDIDVSIYVGSTQYNIGSSPQASVNYNTSTISLKEGVPFDSLVRVTYATTESFGGEQTYTVSQPPVWRPPFRIEEDRSDFILESDRTSEMVPGKLLRVAEFPFYITASTYDPSTNTTRVEFVPETQLEAGSRNPASDSLSVLTDRPISKTLNPSARDGFWIDITSPYDPVNRGFQKIIFQGDLSGIAVVGHLLEIGGLPFIISGNELSEDGTKTAIEITSFFPRGFNTTQDPARISARPVYAPLPTQFIGRGGLVVEEGFELIVFGETDDSGTLLPGRTLRPSIDYVIDEDTGSVEFLSPPQGPLLPTQTLYLRHTQLRTTAPVISNDVLLTPRFFTRFTHIDTPSEENGYLGNILRAQYTFSSPDTWFYRTTPLLNYLGEVAEEVSRELAASLPSSGPAPAIIPPMTNATMGRLGLKAQARNLKDRDRAARVFLEFYNETVLSFEQVRETVTGDIIGDRDGKFQFFIGRGKDLPPPGYEDPISGELNSRNIFSELFFAYNPKVVHLFRDPLVDPFNFQVDDDQLEGSFIDPDLLDDLRNEQRLLIKNDVDDVVLIGRSKKRLSLFPLRLEAFGKYRRLGSPSSFSRIFPERADAFTLTDPGIGADLEANPIDPGVYAFRKRIKRLSFKTETSGTAVKVRVQLPKRASTFLKSIGEVENPVLGQIENISSISVRRRLPRARIYAYSPTGFPGLDPFLPPGVDTFTETPRPAVIATPLPLHEFPVGENGLPDVSRLAAQGGDLIDLSTGDPELFTPAFRETDASTRYLPKVAFGRPNGNIIDVQRSESVSFEFPTSGGGGIGDPVTFTTNKSVFVGELLLGCVVTFATEAHTPGDSATLITTGDDLLEVSEDPGGSNPPIQLVRGDTLFITPSDADVDPGADPDAPETNSSTEAKLEGLPEFRLRFDVGVNRVDGEFRDMSLPSLKDPSVIGLKEVLGQRPPKPLETLESEVRFRNSDVEPLRIPALTGGFTNDSGDYTLPYLYAQNTEKDQLGVVAKALDRVFVDTLVPSAAYPDEVQGVDGLVANGALLTDLDLTPVSSAGGYIPNSGLGDVEPFDLLLVETGQGGTGLPLGSQGILSVGRSSGGATGSRIETPRFVTPTRLGERIRYRLRTAMSFINQDTFFLPPGMVVRRVGSVTQFDITQISTGLLVFNDGAPAVVSGGLNNLFTLGTDNRIVLNLFTASSDANPSPVFLQSITLDFSGGGSATGDVGTIALGAGAVTADDNFIYVETPVPFLTLAPNPGLVPPVLPEDPSNPGNSIPLWFTLDIDLTFGGAGNTAVSNTGRVLEDRLTFEESFDLRRVLPRSAPDVDGVAVFSELDVAYVTSQTTTSCTVNDSASVNGGDPFTFLAGGTFDFLSGRGTVRVPGFEGHNNTPISASSVVFSAVPSSAYAEGSGGVIATGTGVAGTSLDRNFRISSDGVTLLETTSGSLGNIQPGDTLVVKGSSDVFPVATTKAGTYLVKQVVEPDPSQFLLSNSEFVLLILETKTLPFNTNAGWADIQFPIITKSTLLEDGGITISKTTLDSDGSSAWPTTSGNLYVITKYDPDDPSYGVSNFVVPYVVLDTLENRFVAQIPAIRSFDGSVTGFEAASIIDALSSPTIVTGFNKFDVRMDRAPEYSLPRGCVGHDNGGTTYAGFRAIDIAGSGAGAGNVSFVFGGDLVGIAPLTDQIGVIEASPVSNTSFNSNPDAIVYSGVAQYIEIDQSPTNTYWDTVHAPSASGVFAILPGDILKTQDAFVAPPNDFGFYAQTGIFLEPSVPTPNLDLNGGSVRVVDSNNSVPLSTLGFRDGTLYGEGPTEGVTWEVRRIRRFHRVLQNIGELLGPLRYVYETRRGTVSAFGPAEIGPDNSPYPYVLEAAGTGTQLGGFSDALVNVNPGDMFRLLAEDGKTVLDEVEIGGIDSDTTLWLKAPGIVALPPEDVVGKAFELYIRNVPVPHTQSNEQLLQLITEKVMINRQGSFSTQEGGIVPTPENPTDARVLEDTDKSINFINLGVAAGDILIIDPAGDLSGPLGAIPATGKERGSRAFGDRSVPNRTVAQVGQEIPFRGGSPSELDDNRGWYRVTEVTSDKITVTSQTEFTGDPGDPFVTFGSEAEYAVLPTVSSSEAPFADPPGGPGIEGQMDLRPTSLAGENGSPANSFRGNLFSVGPLSYRIIRPSALFSEEAIDLVLLMRERTLSFLEEFEVFFQENKFGNYFIFQRDDHISDLGDPLLPEEGLGVVSNELVDNVRGQVAITPFANTSDCLGVLDRRFWINDYRLDSEFPVGSDPNTPSYSTLESNANNLAAEEGDGRPVLPDLIDEVLDQNDQFRDLRYSWLDFRVNREDGTLIQISLFERQSNRRAFRSEAFSKLQQGFKDAGVRFQNASSDFIEGIAEITGSEDDE